MLEAIKHIIRALREEAARRRWLSVVKALIVLAGYIGLSIFALHPILKWLFPSSFVAAWVIIVSSALIIALLVIVNFMRTYHERTTGEALQIWSENTEILEELYDLRKEGRRLSHYCYRCQDDSLSSNDIRDVSSWHRHAAGVLERQLGIEYRRSFYEHSETGENAPNNPHQCHVWIDVRLVKLERAINKLKQPPPQLISDRATEQIKTFPWQA